MPGMSTPEACPHGVTDANCKECYEAGADLSRCPQCGGPADNGHDRSIPPNPYFCTKCMAEPYDQTSLELCEVCGWKTLIPGDCCLNCERISPCPNCASLQDQNTELDRKLAELERKPLTDEEIKRIDDSTHFHESPDWSLRFARAVERAHGIGDSDE